MIKRITAAVLACLLVFAVSGCGQRSVGAPLTVNGSPIDAETFTYFLNEGFSGNTDKLSQINAAVESVRRYCAISSLLAVNGGGFSADETATATEEAGTLWNMFGAFYRGENVSKATFVKIYIADKYREKLRSVIFGKGGTQEIGDEYLRGALKEYFVAYKTVTVPLYSKNVYGTRVDFTAEETEAARHAMSDGAAKLNDGQNIEAVASQISVDYPLAKYSDSTIVCGPDSRAAAAGFVEAVSAMEEGSAGTIEADGMLYIVQRIDILSDVNILEDNRAECIELLSEAPLENLIAAEAEKLTVEKNSSAINDCYSAVSGNRKAFLKK